MNLRTVGVVLVSSTCKTWCVYPTNVMVSITTVTQCYFVSLSCTLILRALPLGGITRVAMQRKNMRLHTPLSVPLQPNCFSFFSAAFAICFPVMSCRLAFHQYRFPYSMKATHLASLHAMFPSCFDFATLTIAGPSFGGGVLLLNTSFKCKFFNRNR